MASQEESILSGIGQKYNFRPIIYLVIKYWYLYAIIVTSSMVIAYLINKYTIPVYKVSSSVMINDKQSSSAQSILGDKNRGMSFVDFGSSLADEVQIITSRQLTSEVLNNLDFSVSYYEIGHISTQEIYNQSPIRAHILIKDSSVYGNAFYVQTQNEKEFKLVFKYPKTGESYSGIFKFGQMIKFKFGDIVLTVNDSLKKVLSSESKEYKFFINSKESLIKEFNEAITTKNDRETNLLNILISSSNVQKGVDFLNMLCKVYLEKNLETKNQISERSIQFINNQLEEISNSLNSVESDLENFKESKNSVDLTDEARQFMANLNEISKQQQGILLRLNSLELLKSYIILNKDLNILAPALEDVRDPSVVSFVEQLRAAQSSLKELQVNVTDAFPSIKILKDKISNAKKLLLENINNTILTTKSSIAAIREQMNEIEGQLKNVPHNERELLQIKRRFSLSENLYLYMLQKRAELSITKAANIADNTLVDGAAAKGVIKPLKSQNYTIAIMIGLFLPSLLIYVINMLDDKIRNRFQVEKASIVPLIGIISHNFKKINLVVNNNPKSHIAEAFRAIRTNLQYFSTESEKKVILTSSTVGGEGKTFFCMNLATIFAMSDKKVILLGFDLRKPKLFSDFKLKNDLGITNYLIGKAEIKDIIQPTQIENLYFISSGPIPPNPAELIQSDKIPQLFETLKKEYDYVIVDTPPLGLVTDAILLMDYSNINVYVMRENYSRLNFLQAINGLVETRKLKNTCIVLNDSNIYSSSYRYGYSYGYGSGYGYGYGYGGYGGYGSYSGYGSYGGQYGGGSYNYGYGYGYGYGYYDEDDDQHKKNLFKKIIKYIQKKLNITPRREE